MKSVQLENTEETIYAHEDDVCVNEVCSIHNRTDHSMRSFPQHWRNDRGIMERICEHNCGHPDPDDFSILNGDDDGIHGCDGCCVPALEETTNAKTVLDQRITTLEFTVAKLSKAIIDLERRAWPAIAISPKQYGKTAAVYNKGYQDGFNDAISATGLPTDARLDIVD